MKISHLLGIIGFGALLTACSEDTPTGSNNVAPEDEVHFSVNTSSVNTRTMYGEENSDGTAQGLYWGNYNNWIADSIKVFSPHTRFDNANYLIKPAQSNSNTASEVTRLGEYGLQWGSNTDNLTNYEFYAFYPASRCGDQVTYSDKTASGTAVVDAWIRPGQSPVKFTTTTSGRNKTYLGNPDMRACLMTAHTSAKYGADAVGFHFKPLATVLDVTIQGPQSQTNSDDIYLVSLRSKSGKAIVGNFKVDLGSNQIVENSITNGESRITMQPRNSTYDESTHLPTSAELISLGMGDVMKVRFFLIPRTDLQISDLELTVTTKDSEYVKTLTNADIASNNPTLTASQIKKVTLPYLDAANGRAFNVNFWMSQLHPDVYVTELSIPGAYNAASSTLSGSYKFQSVDAQEQFESGVRAFKLRIFDAYNFGTRPSNNPSSYQSKELCYGNDGTRSSLSSQDKNINIGTVAELFSDLKRWMDEEKNKWTKDHPNEPYNDFVVLCFSPNRYYNGGSGTNRFQQSYEISNSLKTAISTFNASNDNAIYTGPITPNTTIGDVAGKIIIHYNASSDVIAASNISKASQVGETASNVNGVDALFSFWNAPENDTYLSRPQLVHMTWGNPPAVSTPVESIPSTSLGWLFYEFNGVKSDTGTDKNYVTDSQMKTAIGNYGTISYVNFQKKEHNIWGYLEIGGRYLPNQSGQNQCTQMANVFNKYLYNYIASGQRTAAPWGIIMMNYADDSSDEATAANSPQLIRAIIANNRLFPPQRKPDSETPTSINNAGNVIVAAGQWDRKRK